MARGRYSPSQSSSIISASSRFAWPVRPPRHSRHGALDGGAVQDRARSGVRVEQQLVDERRRRSAPTQAPTASLKKPRLRLSSTKSGTWSRAASRSTCLPCSRRTLCARRDARAELHQLVVEERHPHLERAGHRGAVEVGEHVVDQAEPRVQVERGLERRGAGRAGQAPAQHAPRRRRRARRARRRTGRRAGRVHEAARREQAGDRIGGLQGVGEPAGAAGPAAQRRGRRRPAQRARHAAPGSASDATRCLR